MIYSIGHGRRFLKDLLNILARYEIQYLIDVRSVPYSKYQPDFNRNHIENNLDHGIIYVFMGDLVGGRPLDKSCYDFTGKIDYLKQRSTEGFRTGIDRLKVAFEKNLNVCVMCSEVDPLRCHRSKSIAVDLLEQNIDVQHILGDDGVIKQSLFREVGKDGYLRETE